MDPGRGVVCRGPEGPECDVGLQLPRLGLHDLPHILNASTELLLVEGVCLRYLAGLRSWIVDDSIVWELSRRGTRESLHLEDIDYSGPMVISPSVPEVVAYGRGGWLDQSVDFCRGQVLGSGVNRSRWKAASNI
ncbi:hypothetical protein AAF712_009753 [Marasmius tenuissimus]|uniref:Uncharacterized protein n=1 Tax=Marasmius tenuissimus TaxID=585030 RepID=A0ABR2ZPS3_9AGAR